MPVMRHNSGGSVTSLVGLFWLPCGRPGQRVAGEDGGCIASALAWLAAVCASLRTPGSTRRGNERRAWVLTKDHVQKARPGTGVPYSLAKHRSRPWEGLARLGDDDVSAPPAGRRPLDGPHADASTPKTAWPTGALWRQSVARSEHCPRGQPSGTGPPS